MNACEEKKNTEIDWTGKLSHHDADLTPGTGNVGGSRIEQGEPQKTIQIRRELRSKGYLLEVSHVDRHVQALILPWCLVISWGLPGTSVASAQKLRQILKERADGGSQQTPLLHVPSPFLF